MNTLLALVMSAVPGMKLLKKEGNCTLRNRAVNRDVYSPDEGEKDAEIASYFSTNELLLEYREAYSTQMWSA